MHGPEGMGIRGFRITAGDHHRVRADHKTLPTSLAMSRSSVIFGLRHSPPLCTPSIPIVVVVVAIVAVLSAVFAVGNDHGVAPEYTRSNERYIVIL